MKKFITFLMLAMIVVASMAQSDIKDTKDGYILIGGGMMSAAFTYNNAVDFLSANDTMYIDVTSKQYYLQVINGTFSFDSISGDPSIAYTLFGKIFTGDSWTSLTTGTWTGEPDNPFAVTYATANKYRYFRVMLIASGAAQHSHLTNFELKSTLTSVSTGLITGTAGATITGAAINLNASSNFATNIGTGSTNAAITIGGNSNTVAVNSSDWDISTTGVMTGIGAITSDGLITATGGLTLATVPSMFWAAGGSVITAATGTDVAFSAGARYWVEVNIPYNQTITGAGVLLGSVGGTDSLVIQLCNSAGVQVATTRHGGAGKTANLAGTTATIQSIAFATPYAAVAGRYFIVLQTTGTTAKFRAYAIPGLKFIANTAAGTWGTAANITPGTTFVADKGPISILY